MNKLLLLTMLMFSIGNANAEWIPANGPYGGSISALATNGSSVFAGSSYVNQYGIFTSKNNGVNWSAASTTFTFGENIYGFSFMRDSIFAATDNGIMLSADGGYNWALATTGVGGARCVLVNNDTILAGAYGLYRSVNKGGNWSQTGLYLRNVSGLILNGHDVFAATSQGVSVSSDNGSTWTDRNSGLTNTDVHAVAFNGTNLFAGTDGGVFLSTDSGAHWTPANSGLPFSLNYSFAVSGGSIFVGTQAGMFRSSDNGSNWTPVTNGFTTTFFYSTAVNGNRFYAGTDKGIFLSTDNGSSWSSLGTFMRVGAQALVNMGNNIIVANNKDVYLSTNNASSWKLLSTFSGTTLIENFAVKGTEIFAGTNYGVVRSSDTGKTWIDVSIGLPQMQVSAIAVKDSDIFAANGNGLFLSTNRGSSWTLFNSQWTGINGLAISGENIIASGHWVEDTSVNGSSWHIIVSGGALAFCGSNLIEAGGNGIAILKSNGDVYQPSAMMNIWVYSLAVSGSNVLAGVSGVSISHDYGHSWTAFNDGMYSAEVTHPLQETKSLTIIGDTIYALTNVGIWTRPLSELIGQCGSNFSIQPVAGQPHHYSINDFSSGAAPLSYDWNWGDGNHDYTPTPNHTYTDTGFYDICVSISDHNGCTSSYCDSSFHTMRSTNTMVYVDVVNPNLPTGIKDHAAEQSVLMVYPNPVQDDLFIAGLSDHTLITIYNLLGEAIYTESSNRQQETVNCKPFTAGIYFLRIKTEEGSVVKRFVKER